MNKDEALEFIAIAKAKQMANNPNYKIFYERIIKELGITQPSQAFLVGAIDAMIYDVDSATALSRMKLSYEERRNLIEKIFKEILPQK
jgi:hypothetical protein